MTEKRNFKVKGSWGVYDAYKMLRKKHWLGIGHPVTEHDFYTIIRSVNELLADEIANGHTVKFPERMGTLELWKYQVGAYIKDGKLKITYPVNWYATKQLWEQDAEAKKNKTLIYHSNEWVYNIKYLVHNANYENKSFYLFTLNNFVKKALSYNLRHSQLDTAYQSGGHKYKRTSKMQKS